MAVVRPRVRAASLEMPSWARRLYLAIARWYDTEQADRRVQETDTLVRRAHVRRREILASGVAARYKRQDMVWRER